MIPLAVPNLAGREAEYLQECITSTFVSTVGPFVGRFEKMVAEASGAKHAVATSAGTTALHAALVASGVGHGDLVIAPSFTFIASVAAIAHCGAQPWLFDVAAHSWTLDPDLLAAALESETERHDDGSLRHRPTGKRVAAILPVYTLGIPADMDPIVALGARYGLPVVADAAAALGTSYKNRPSGSLGADFTMFSFNGNKTVTAGGGGIIVTDDDAKAKLFRHLTTTARVGADYDHDMVGFNYRMTNLQAAVGCAQMENLDQFLEAKRRIAIAYRDAFAGLDMVEPFPDPDYVRNGHWFSGVVLRRDYARHLPDVRARLREAGIDARPFWKPAHLQPPYATAPVTAMPVSDDIWARVLTLPCSTGLTASDQARVIDVTRDEIAKL
ncbi:DegT/DnrJ/EryC1/StrS family aminotransferase [Hoeflea olei]|uniref:Pyridoxal-5'-phosphate-dependent protein n=1 Tax=Hoeflea olei TaxID=1480615 RepID=A0A1C1YUC9_9HYPH|nr:DegT/DnrJ/EryC1/StrS family aminotransferase [Hoeflea olei]OCW56986.1 pyridoxal-5'-phosphate-dependent protein [Hoeflea olei]